MVQKIKGLVVIVLIFSFNLGNGQSQERTTLFVGKDTLHAKPVSPLIYGNFIELGFARQIEGLWGQKLRNSSFEVVPPYNNYQFDWLKRKKEDDLSIEPWWHSGYQENSWYTYPVRSDVNITYNRYWNFHHGLQAAVLRNPLPEGKVRLAQDGIFLETGSPTRFMGYFSNNKSADSNPSPVKAKIGIYPEKDFEKPLYETSITISDGIWREFSLEIPVLAYAGAMTFAVSIDEGSTIACDGFSLMPVNIYGGWRPQVVEALKQIGVPMIRFPGGCFSSFYDWREGVGPRLDRQPVKSEYWGGIEENQAGTAEFIGLCKMVGAKPFLCVNILTGTADHAADWVEYCNAATTLPMGNLRKQHGYPESFHVQYWELDNETYRRFGWEEYAHKCVEYSKAMKAVDPGIKLVMVGYWRFNEHLGEMLKIAGPYIDIITNRATGEDILRLNLEVINRYNRENGTSITLSNTEWLAPVRWEQNTLDALNYQKPPDSMTLQQHQISWHYAMNVARQLLLFQRFGGDFEFANFNNLANTWGQNIIECPKDTVFISAAGRVFELMNQHPVSWIIKSEMDKNIPGVYSQAGISPKGDQLIIYILNYNSDPKQIRIDQGNRNLSKTDIRIRSVYANNPLSSNTATHPDEIKTVLKSVKFKGKPEVTVLPWSVNEIILSLNEIR